MTDLERALDKYKRNDRRNEWFDCCYHIYKDSPLTGIEYVRDFRREVTAKVKDNLESNMSLLRRSYILTAPDYFDDFMIGMEWDRVPTAKFYLPRRKVLEGKHHIVSDLQAFMDSPASEAKKFTLSLPPGTGKTTLIKFLLSYVAGKYSQSMNMYCSYADGMVKLVYDAVNSMISDEEYNFKEIFPDLGKPDVSSEYHTLSYRRKGDAPTLGLVALGGSVTGRTRANKFFITDDLVKNSEVALSPERLDKLWSDYTNTLTTRMIGDDVKEIMLGTIWSLYDPISRTKTKYDGTPGYKFVAIPVKDEEGNSNFEYDHPDRYTRSKIDQIEGDLDPVTFSCLYMQKGVEKEGLIFDKDRLQYYNGELPEGEPDNIIAHADVAWGGGDSFAMPIAYLYGNDVYIHDVMFDKHDKSVTRPRVEAIFMRHKVKKANFEANNGGDEYADNVSRELREKNYSMHITSKKAPSTMSKITRIEQHQDSIRRFYFLDREHQSPEYRQFMNEVCTFSITSKNLHDDAPDSLAGLCDVLYRGVVEARLAKRPF